MKTTHVVFRLSLLWLALLPLAASAAGGTSSIKCWTNNEGVKECGSVVPPEYVPKGHQVLSTDGVLVKEVGAQKSAEEVAEIRRLEAEERARLEAEKRRQDEGKALLDAYPTESDIILARDGKLASVGAAILVAENQIAFFERNLEQVDKAMQTKPTQELRKHSVDLKEQIAKFQGIKADRLKEQDTIKADYEILLQKYREFKDLKMKPAQPGGNPAEAPGAAKPADAAKEPAASK
jgi:hypothetical protein